MKFEIISVQSNGNSVTVANADNNGNGVANTAVFDYSQLVDLKLDTTAESGNKTIRFNNPNTVLFSFTARIKANVNVVNGTSATSGTVSYTHLTLPTSRLV